MYVHETDTTNTFTKHGKDGTNTFTSNILSNRRILVMPHGLPKHVHKLRYRCNIFNI